MFTARPVTVGAGTPDHVLVFAHRRGSAAARVALATVFVVAALAAPVDAATAGPGTRGPAPSVPAAEGDGGSDDGLVTFGITTGSSGGTDNRGFMVMSAPPGAELYDNVAVVNYSDEPLTLDTYAADAVNSEDGTLVIPDRSQAPSLAGTWLKLGTPTVDLAAQTSGTGPGVTMVPVTISIPEDAEPGDHVGAVVASMTVRGQAGDDRSPALDLEQRTGLRVYITVQGDIRPGLTVHDVHVRFLAGGAFGPGTLRVEYTLTNSGNVRYGIEPSVRATGPFGLAARTADGTTIDELLPRSSVTQTVTLADVWPMLAQNVTVSADAVAAPGADDPGIGTVRATAWAWAWSWLVLVVLAAVALAVWLYVRRRRSVGVWPGMPGGRPGGGPEGRPDADGGSSPGRHASDESAPAREVVR